MNEEEISLKEIMLILIKGWKIILSTSAVAILIASIVVTIFNTTTYSATLSGSINMIDVYQTDFGTFNSNIATIDTQVNLINSFEYNNHLKEIDNQSFVITSKIINTSDFSLQIISVNQLTVENIAKEIQKSFNSYLNYELQVKAIAFYSLNNEINLNNALSSSKKNEILLNAYKTKLKDIDIMISSNTLNPAYRIIKEEIIKLELSEISNQIQIVACEDAKKDLENLKYESFENYLNATEYIEGFKVNLKLIDDINITSVKKYPSLITITIALILGVMFGTFIVLFRNYWKSN